MRPGRKISLIYSAITTGLVLMAGGVFFAISSRYTERLYYRYMEEKASLVAMERFEKDELDSVKYQNVVWRRQNTIPTSKEIFVNIANKDSADKVMKEFLNEVQLDKLYRGDVVNFRHDREVGTALLYYDNEGTFAVIILSRNPYGEQISNTIGWALLVLIVLSCIILYFISRLYAARMVNRIDQNYQTEKLFVNNASHEINNPLTAIQGECEVALLRERKPGEYRRSLELIQRETDRIIRIMSQLLHFSNGQRMKMNAEPLCISHILQPYADERTFVEIEEDFKVTIPEDVLNIAVRNIVDNAHKYGNGHPVRICAGDHRLTIIDHGIGIPEKELPQVFMPFYRASNVQHLSGSGVGLSLSKSLLESYGVNLKLSLPTDGGVAVVLTFPS